ncbi:hypothetical protein H8D85_00250 [bacterium]|nr:hypothetical protein [bacterium]
MLGDTTIKTSNISKTNIIALDRYIKEVSQGRSHLSAEYERELISEYRSGTSREKKLALDTLVSYNITIFANIAINVLNSMKGGDKIEPIDLMQIAVITFIKKLDTWDETKGSKMITYYYRDVRTKMQRYIMSNAFDIRQGSVYLQHLAYTISRTKAKWLATKQIEPTIRQLSNIIDVSEKTIRYCLRVTSIATFSLEECPTLSKYNAHSEDEQLPLIVLVEKLANKLDIDRGGVFMDLLISLEDKSQLPNDILDNLIKE